MKAAIIGYGKMGREIEKILIERGHDVTLVIDTDNAADLNAANLAGVDVALEFTMPSTAYANIRTCIENAHSRGERHHGLDRPLAASCSNCAARRAGRCSILRIIVWA